MVTDVNDRQLMTNSVVKRTDDQTSNWCNDARRQTNDDNGVINRRQRNEGQTELTTDQAAATGVSRERTRRNQAVMTKGRRQTARRPADKPAARLDMWRMTN